jgi:hypothetical protein
MIRNRSICLAVSTAEARRLGSVQRARRGAALLASMFVMSAVSMTVIGILQTETVQFAALRNTIDYDRARYLAEAGMNHALSTLETDISWRVRSDEPNSPPTAVSITPLSLWMAPMEPFRSSGLVKRETSPERFRLTSSRAAEFENKSSTASGDKLSHIQLASGQTVGC